MSVTNPTLTGWSGFWQMTGDFNPYAPFNNAAPTTGLLGWRSKLEWQIAKLADKQQFREIKTLMTALLGAVAGGTATKTYTRVFGPPNTEGAGPFGQTGVGDLGGLIPMEVVTSINRVTTAADVTYLKSMFNNDMLMRGLSLQSDLSGNGAGFGGKNSMAGW